MARFTVRTETGQVIAVHAPGFRLRSVLLFALGLLALAIEITAGYRHHNDAFVPFGGDTEDPRINWWIFIGMSILVLALGVWSVVSPRWGLFTEEIRFTADIVFYRRNPSWLFRPNRYEMSKIRWPYVSDRGGLEFAYGDRSDRTVRIGAGMLGSQMRETVRTVLQEFPQLTPLWSRCADPPADPDPYLPITGRGLGITSH